MFFSVLRCDGDLPRAFDNVLAGDDVAVALDDDSASCAFRHIVLHPDVIGDGLSRDRDH